MSKVFHFPVNEDLKSIKEMKWKDGIFSREQLTDEEFSHHVASLASLISGAQSDRATKRGYTIFVKGGWGVGKTSFTWKLVNELRDQCESPFLVHDESLLPFGNIDESLSLYLQKLAEKIWHELAVDIRKEMKQFILEATSGDEYKATIGLGSFFQVSRTIGSSKLDAIAEIARKLSTKNDHKIILVIDDLDRLKQDEIVVALRMIEKLRRLPGIFVFVPVHMNIINNALSQTLGLRDGVSGFVNKLIDYEITLHNSLDDLKRAFIENYKHGEDTALESVERVWCMLLHNIILAEAVRYWHNERVNADLVEYELAEKSGYFQQISNLLQWHVSEKESSTPFIAKADNLGVEPFRDVLTRGEDNGMRSGYLEKLRRISSLSIPVITNDKVLNDDKPIPQLIRPLVDDDVSPAFFSIFLPWLQHLRTREPLVTNNYSLRDMSMMARSISSKVAAGEAWDVTYGVVSTVYDEFVDLV